MPYYRKRRTFKKRSNRSYRKKFSRKRRSGMGETGKRFMKLKATSAITTSGTGVIVGNIGNDPTGLQDWSSAAALFDSYRVAAIKIKWIPRIPNDGVATTPFAPLYVVGDSNDAGNLASVNEAIQFENLRTKNMYRPWSYYMYCQKLGNTSLMRGYRAITDTTASQSVKYYGDGFSNSIAIGTFVITHYIVFKNRK